MPPGVRFSLLYASLFFELGINLPFFPIWLRAQSLDDGLIGLILAMPLLARVLANPLVTAAADRHNRVPGTLLACAILVAVGTPLFSSASGVLPIFVLATAIGLAQGPLIALADAVTLAASRAVSGLAVDYGRARLWGSIAFAAANISAGIVLMWLPAAMIIWLLSASAALTVAAAIAVARLPATPGHHFVDHAGKSAGSSRLIILVVIGAACVQASHGMIYAFGTLHWQSSGLSRGATGTLWALGVVSEIAVFACAGRIIGNAKAAALLLLIGAAAAVLRWVGMAIDPGIEALVALQLCHGFTFGATHMGSIVLLSLLASAGTQAQVQGWLAAAWAGSMAILTAVCGQIYPSWGERTYLFVAGVAATGLVLLCAAALLARRGHRRVEAC